nr:hypothetical protein P5630_17865 [Bacillus subtilis]
MTICGTEQPHVFTLEYAYEEAEAKFGRDPREYSIQTTKMVADKNGKLKELHTIQMEKVKNEHGKYEFRKFAWNGKSMVCSACLYRYRL